MIGGSEGRTGTLVGKVMTGADAGGQIQVEACDGKLVLVDTQGVEEGPNFYSPQQVYEFVGSVVEGSLHAAKAVAYSDDFDMNLYDKTLSLAHGKFADLFWG